MPLLPTTCFCVLSMFGQQISELQKLSELQQGAVEAPVAEPVMWPLEPVQEMLNEIGPGFRQFDRNGNGVIERDELPKVVGPVRVILEARDQNKDGRITRAEYAGLRTTKSSVRSGDGPRLPAIGIPQQDNRGLFDLLDQDNNGVVTLDEVQDPMKSRVMPYFRAAGKNQLTLADWTAAYAKLNERKETRGPDFFKTLDRNNDGQVTLEEIDAAAQAELNLSGVETKSLLEVMRQSGKQSFSRAEIEQLIGPIVKRADLRRKLRSVFRNLDANNDGRISVAEAPQNERADLEKFLSSRKQPLGAELTEDQFIKLFEEAMPADPMPRFAHKPAAFQILDRNRDGYIDPKELVDVSPRLYQLDANADDRLSLAEFLGEPGKGVAPEPPPPIPTDTQAPKSSPQATLAGFVASFFKKYDTDNNGRLTIGELDEQRIRRADYNEDGAMSRAELREYMSRRQQ